MIDVWKFTFHSHINGWYSKTGNFWMIFVYLPLIKHVLENHPFIEEIRFSQFKIVINKYNNNNYNDNNKNNNNIGFPSKPRLIAERHPKLPRYPPPPSASAARYLSAVWRRTPPKPGGINQSGFNHPKMAGLLWLVGGFNLPYLPLWKMMEWKSVGMMKFPIDGREKKNVPNHQPVYYGLLSFSQRFGITWLLGVCHQFHLRKMWMRSQYSMKYPLPTTTCKPSFCTGMFRVFYLRVEGL